MSVFADKKFEGLDWISQATEPIDSELNEILALIPDEVNIDFETYVKIARSTRDMDLSVGNMLSYYLRQTGKSVSWQQSSLLNDCFEFQMEGEVNLDFEQKLITGEVKFIKVKATMDEDVLKNVLGRNGIEQVGSMYFNGPGLGRANEIMELLGKCESGLRTRSERKKRHVIRERLKILFKDNEWNIRDTELADKVGSWIRHYVVDGNLAAFSNFCRLKVMTHKGQPIYSMEEIS